jgi:RNA polymerase sigma factor (sigma-70 family)
MCYDNITDTEKHEILDSLVREYQKKPSDAIFGQIVRICKPILVYFANRYNYGSCSSADVYQTGLMSLYEAVNSYSFDKKVNKTRHVYSWVYKFAKNRIITAMIRTTAQCRNYGRTCSLDELEELEHRQFKDGGNWLDEMMTDEEIEYKKADFYIYLSELEIKILEMRQKSYRHKEIAAKLGISVKSCQNAIARCLVKWEAFNGDPTRHMKRTKVSRDFYRNKIKRKLLNISRRLRAVDKEKKKSKSDCIDIEAEVLPIELQLRKLKWQRYYEAQRQSELERAKKNYAKNKEKMKAYNKARYQRIREKALKGGK